MPVSIESTYFDGPGAVWLRGNLHAHSTVSDGDASPQAVIDRYAELGYDFLMLSDHDVLSDYRGLDPRGMSLLPGYEVSVNGPHILHVMARETVEPDHDRAKVLDAIGRSEGFAILCHPNWLASYNHYRLDLMRALKGYAGIEVCNSSIYEDPGQAWAADKWDMLLSEGLRFWGYANDDAHDLESCGRGWNVVRARDRSVAAISEALRDGSFYASTGVEIASLAVEGDRLRIETTEPVLFAVVGEHGRQLARVEGSSLDFAAGDILSPYIRVECWGRGDRMAWTQPMRVRGGAAERLERLSSEKVVLRALSADVTPAGPNDPAWLNAEKSSRFLDSRAGERPEVSTEVAAILSPSHITFLALCEEPAPDRRKLSIRQDQDPRICTDDSVELFFVPGPGEDGKCHIMLNGAGYLYAAGPSGAPLRAEARVARAPNGWAATVSIPLDAIGISAPAKAAYGFHVCRTRNISGERAPHYFWAWVNGNNHAIERYGVLEIDG